MKSRNRPSRIARWRSTRGCSRTVQSAIPTSARVWLLAARSNPTERGLHLIDLLLLAQNDRSTLYRDSGTETVAGGRARRRATPGKVCILESHHVSGAESCLPGVQIDPSCCFDSPHRLRGAASKYVLV